MRRIGEDGSNIIRFTEAVSHAGNVECFVPAGNRFTTISEIFRAGINSLDKGQTYAAQALGMSYWQRMRRIILPQVVKRMIPPLINEFASLMKLTSLASVLAIPELLHTGNDVISTTFRPMEIYTAIGAAYAMLVLPIIYLAHHIDRAWGRKAA